MKISTVFVCIILTNLKIMIQYKKKSIFKTRHLSKLQPNLLAKCIFDCRCVTVNIKILHYKTGNIYHLTTNVRLTHLSYRWRFIFENACVIFIGHFTKVAKFQNIINSFALLSINLFALTIRRHG